MRNTYLGTSALVAILCASATLVGCGGTNTGGSGGTGGTGGANGSLVTLELTDTYLTESNQSTQNRDIGMFTSIEALVTANDGTVQSFTGALSADGSRYEIPNVPEVPYWLALTSPPPEGAVNTPPVRTLYQMKQEERVVDFGRIFAGRPDIVSGTQPLDVTLDAGGMAPWQQAMVDNMGNPIGGPQDGFELYSYNADALAMLTYFGDKTGAPANGATSLNGLVFPWLDMVLPAARERSLLPLIDGAKGDITHVTHIVQHEVTDPVDPSGPWGSYTYDAAEEALSSNAVTMKDGQPAQISGTFAPLPPASFAMDFKGSLFASEVETNGPGAATTGYASVSIHQEPGTPYAVYGNPPTLLSVLAYGETVTCAPDANGMCDPVACAAGCNGASKLVLPGDHQHSFTYGNPYTSHGMERFSALVSFRMRPKHPVEGSTERLDGNLWIGAPPADVTGKPITPIIGLPRNVKLDNKTMPVDVATSEVGSTPVLTFDAPATGMPSHYIVSVIQLDNVLDAQGNTLRSYYTVLSARTTDTSFRIPAGVLQSGRYYYVAVTATLGTPTADKPFKHTSATDAQGRTYTGMFTP